MIADAERNLAVVIVPAAKVGSQPRFCARVKLRPRRS